MTEKVYDSYRGLILSLGMEVHHQKQNLNLTHDARQEMHFEFQKATF